MFSGHWMESELPIIQIDIPDANITTDGIMFLLTVIVLLLLFLVALDIAFSSLYKDSVHLSASIVTSTVAAAAMLQMVY